MIILKLGGSVVTDKSRPFTVRSGLIKRLAREIKESGKRVVLVHGGGSFGHPLASEYELQDGLTEGRQIFGVAKTRLAMDELNNQIIDIFVEAGVSAVSVQTSTVFKCKNKRIEKANLEPVEDFLKIGLTPVLYGDVVLDRAQGVCILSGDQIVAYLTRKFKPEKVILATDVDGVLDNKGVVIEVINSKNASSCIRDIATTEGDVTGGMKGKVEELVELTKSGVSALVINAAVEDRVKNALLGKRTIGTLFEESK
jgi:isopentenyl phosphate kinase